MSLFNLKSGSALKHVFAWACVRGLAARMQSFASNAFQCAYARQKPYPFCVHRDQDPKRVYYLSMEFLMGRSLLNTLYNIDVHENYEEALREMGYK